MWSGAVRIEDADAYAEYMRETGIPGYRSVPGNLGVYMLRRQTEDLCVFVMFTLWDSMDAVRAFAGNMPDRAVFYPEDDRFLVDRDLTVTHYEVDALDAS